MSQPADQVRNHLFLKRWKLVLRVDSEPKLAVPALESEQNRAGGHFGRQVAGGDLGRNTRRVLGIVRLKAAGA